MTTGQFQRLRSALLTFFEDLHIRVSIFLTGHIQTQTGAFIINKSRQLAHGIEAPGSLRLYNSNGKWLKTKAFNAGATFTPAGKKPSYGLTGDRITKLGLNLFGDSNADGSVTASTGSNDQGNLSTTIVIFIGVFTKRARLLQWVDFFHRTDDEVFKLFTTRTLKFSSTC